VITVLGIAALAALFHVITDSFTNQDQAPQWSSSPFARRSTP
jgi:hypothetical protein